MRRSAPKRKRRQRPVRITTGVEIAMANKLLFKDAARDQRICQAPGCRNAREFHAHHVIYEQHLRVRGLPPYSTPNALRLCPECHELHHKRRKIIPVVALLDRNIEYAFVALGPAAFDYLERYYAGPADERARRELARLEDAA